MAPATPRRLESPGSTSNEMAPLIENQPATGIFTLSPGTISTPCVDVSNTARQFRPAGPVLYIASASESFARGNCRPSCVDERPGPPPLRVPARTIVKSAPMAFALSMTFFSSAVYADTYSPPAQMSGLEKSFAPLMRKPSPSPLPSRPEAPLRLMNTIFFTWSSFICWFVRPFIRSFVRPSVRSCVRLFESWVGRGQSAAAAERRVRGGVRGVSLAGCRVRAAACCSEAPRPTPLSGSGCWSEVPGGRARASPAAARVRVRTHARLCVAACQPHHASPCSSRRAPPA
mmetsp:Transcript_91761/g.262352  ORF Transcript_91761/g.262352 Transcript_91761/m.262352 type:complete len:288 (-) Transcript_91761:312-1175(-)